MTDRDIRQALTTITVEEFTELIGLQEIVDRLAGMHRLLVTINRRQEQIMASIKDLAGKDAALADELTTFITDVQNKLNQLGQLSPEDQAVVDQVSADLDAFNAKLQANDPNQPAPAPAPSPAPDQGA